MSCWVVPSLAADVWQIPLEQLLRRMTEGDIPTKQEEGFTFVDMAPNGPKLERPRTPAEERPAMCTSSAEEPGSGENGEQDKIGHPPIDAPAESIEEVEDENGPPDITGSKELGDWRAARRRASRTRIPPRRQQTLA